MKLVIDISDQKYKWIVDNPQVYTDDLCEVIRNGTPLPEHHGRLIEVTNQLEQELFTFQRYTGIDEAPYESATIITDRAPTIIEGSDAE